LTKHTSISSFSVRRMRLMLSPHASPNPQSPQPFPFPGTSCLVFFRLTSCSSSPHLPSPPPRANDFPLLTSPPRHLPGPNPDCFLPFLDRSPLFYGLLCGRAPPIKQGFLVLAPSVSSEPFFGICWKKVFLSIFSFFSFASLPAFFNDFLATISG